ncbi:MAG: class I SAM-dependent methyltransferase [Candidatus Thorarchaeota archaeon]
MTKDASSWERAYREVSSLWGLEPDWRLVEYAPFIPKGKVLDLGSGEGRNALFFASMGYEVECIDISETAITRCLDRANGANLELRTRVADLKGMTIPEERYVLIIAAWVLQFFAEDEIWAIVDKIKRGLTKGGTVYVGVFSLENLIFNSRIHYFTRDEVLSLFSDMEVIYNAEGIMLDLSHGEPHHHGFIEHMSRY